MALHRTNVLVNRHLRVTKLSASRLRTRRDERPLDTVSCVFGCMLTVSFWIGLDPCSMRCEELRTSNKRRLCCSYLFAGRPVDPTLDQLPPLNRLPVTTTSPSNLPASPLLRRIVLIRQVSKVALRSEVSFCTCSLHISLNFPYQVRSPFQ